jgi:hypothetical protein
MTCGWVHKFVTQATLFNRILPEYEKVCLNEYVEGREDKLLYANTAN